MQPKIPLNSNIASELVFLYGWAICHQPLLLSIRRSAKIETCKKSLQTRFIYMIIIFCSSLFPKKLPFKTYYIFFPIGIFLETLLLDYMFAFEIS